MAFSKSEPATPFTTDELAIIDKALATFPIGDFNNPETAEGIKDILLHLVNKGPEFSLLLDSILAPKLKAKSPDKPQNPTSTGKMLGALETKVPEDAFKRAIDRQMAVDIAADFMVCDRSFDEIEAVMEEAYYKPIFKLYDVGALPEHIKHWNAEQLTNLVENIDKIKKIINAGFITFAKLSTLEDTEKGYLFEHIHEILSCIGKIDLTLIELLSAPTETRKIILDFNFSVGKLQKSLKIPFKDFIALPSKICLLIAENGYKIEQMIKSGATNFAILTSLSESMLKAELSVPLRAMEDEVQTPDTPKMMG